MSQLITVFIQEEQMEVFFYASIVKLFVDMFAVISKDVKEITKYQQ